MVSKRLWISYLGRKINSLQKFKAMNLQVAQIMKIKDTMKNSHLLAGQEDYVKVDEVIQKPDLLILTVRISKNRYRNHFGRYGQIRRKKSTSNLSRNLGKISQRSIKI